MCRVAVFLVVWRCGCVGGVCVKTSCFVSGWVCSPVARFSCCCYVCILTAVSVPVVCTGFRCLWVSVMYTPPVLCIKISVQIIYVLVCSFSIVYTSSCWVCMFVLCIQVPVYTMKRN